MNADPKLPINYALYAFSLNEELTIVPRLHLRVLGKENFPLKSPFSSYSLFGKIYKMAIRALCLNYFH